MKVRSLLPALLLLACFSSCNTETPDQEEKRTKPNIVYILADDLGYGDVSIYNPASKIKTPNIDRIATAGMRFTDAHSPSSVCTPTRYGILTGRYCWRSRLPQGVLWGYGRALIQEDRKTVAELLQESDYTTGVVGKWHLGLDWVIKEAYQDSMNTESVEMNEVGIVKEMNPDWLDFTRAPTDGPLDHGFNYSFILPASLDMPPYCFMENDSLLTIPDGHTPGNDLNTGFYGAFWRAGRMSPDFKFEEVLPTFTTKAEQFIADQAQSDEAFFLYMPLAAPHTPWVPKENFAGSSEAGPYGDFVQMVDATVGRISAALEANGVADNTLLIFTSDNGPFWKADKINTFNHRAAYHFKGMKGDIWEGGHRIPFIASWPGHIEAGSQSSHPTTLTNLIATCSDLLNVSLDAKTGEDSQSIWPILMNDKAFVGKPVIHHSSRGFFAIRKGDWKLVEGRGSGGFSAPSIIEPKPGEAIGQLYNLAEDPSETQNLYTEQPEVVAELLADLEQIRGRAER